MLRSRFLLVVLAFVLSFLVRYGLTESAPFLADVAVIFSDRLLLQLVIAEQASEDSVVLHVWDLGEHQTKRSEVTEQAKTHKLAAHHTDAVLTVTERLTIAQSSPSLDNFFGQAATMTVPDIPIPVDPVGRIHVCVFAVRPGMNLQEMEAVTPIMELWFQPHGRAASEDDRLHSVIPSLEHPQIMEAFQEVFVRRGPVEAEWEYCPTNPRTIHAAATTRIIAPTMQQEGKDDDDGRVPETRACPETGPGASSVMTYATKDIKIPPLFPSGILKKEESDGHTLAAMLPGHSCPRDYFAKYCMDPLSMSEHCSNEKKKEEKEIQVSIGTVVMEQGIAQSVQTEFTWSDEGMTCCPDDCFDQLFFAVEAVNRKLAAVWLVPELVQRPVASGSLPRPVLMLPNFEKTSPKYVVRSLAQLMNQSH
ncbi:hypothetical protein AK812_SmicGene16445 [Symbiodinium microadriaticum]|uniref:Uncharacterized protein n=1 Tax=Symbiodinium microadriaticum TaxID=2951 RepID=A0A1Q9E0C5_SYMMI|nr:hypothetical protein AK812_SmicGene16445 [Symbiodinium microadriaticum]